MSKDLKKSRIFNRKLEEVMSQEIKIPKEKLEALKKFQDKIRADIDALSIESEKNQQIISLKKKNRYTSNVSDFENTLKNMQKKREKKTCIEIEREKWLIKIKKTTEIIQTESFQKEENNSEYYMAL